MSKSPGQQNKLLVNTNYGKFKMTPQNTNGSGGGYSRNQGQYLPKLGGTSQGLVNSQQQLPHYNQTQ
jgi:hypothetical protein